MRTCLQALATDAPTHSRWLKSCHKNRVAFYMVAERLKRHDRWNRSKYLETPRQQQQNREQVGHLPETVMIKSGRNHTGGSRRIEQAVSGWIDMLNSINNALRNVTVKTAPEPHRVSDLIPGNREGNDKGEFGPAFVDAWSEEGETMLVSVESPDLTIAHSQDNRGVAVPSTAQNDSKRTTENGAANARTEGSRSMACDLEEIRSKEHVWQKKNSICSTGQQHL